ncbi:hypothetical protein VTK26DRAFT_7397 [Humicola hyalothermophila]
MTAVFLADVAEEVRQRAKNTFLWVALAFRVLDKVDRDLNPVHGKYAPGIIRKMPSGLAELYDHMMIRIEEGIERDPQYCKSVLAAATLSLRALSLSLSELAVLAGLPPAMPPRTIVKKCCSFLTVKDETVYLIHQSARDYLVLIDALVAVNGSATEPRTSRRRAWCEVPPRWLG